MKQMKQKVALDFSPFWGHRNVIEQPDEKKTHFFSKLALSD